MMIFSADFGQSYFLSPSVPKVTKIIIARRHRKAEKYGDFHSPLTSPFLISLDNLLERFARYTFARGSKRSLNKNAQRLVQFFSGSQDFLVSRLGLIGILKMSSTFPEITRFVYVFYLQCRYWVFPQIPSILNFQKILGFDRT